MSIANPTQREQRIRDMREREFHEQISRYATAQTSSKTPVITSETCGHYVDAILKGVADGTKYAICEGCRGNNPECIHHFPSDTSTPPQ